MECQVAVGAGYGLGPRDGVPCRENYTLSGHPAAGKLGREMRVAIPAGGMKREAGEAGWEPAEAVSEAAWLRDEVSAAPELRAVLAQASGQPGVLGQAVCILAGI